MRGVCRALLLCVQHSTAGYMVHAAATCKYVFALSPRDVFWSTGDCGWVTGHTCLTYGALLNGATSVVFEGIPSYPDHGRVWEVVAKWRVKQIYTAPTMLRALMRHDDAFVTRHDRSSLQVRASPSPWTEHVHAPVCGSLTALITRMLHC